MDGITILAESVETTSQASPSEVIPIDIIWAQITSLGLLEALTFISFGAVCLFYGWRVFKILVIISFALLGLVLGVMISEKFIGANYQIASGLTGLGLLAILSVPLMRWAVSILGAVAGAILASGIWYAFGLNDQYMIAGAIIGIVAGGMISFIIFKIAVMLFSSLGGSGLIVTGVLALLYQYSQTTQQVEELVFTNKWFLPAALMVPTIIGVILQNKFIKGSPEWSV
ncbi:MAG: hypothetical protein ACYS1A_07310 [Planctomycetota bacterium]|jgi:hypothetical protein